MTPDPDRNVEGQTTAITVFSTVRWWGRAWLPALFGAVNRFPEMTRTLRDLSFIHFARWAVIRELPYNGPPQRKGKLRHPHLFFESNFNGSWGEYIDAFSNKLTSGMWAFWRSSYGFPGALPVDPFKAYIRAHETVADCFYSAYPGATSTTIQRALARVGVTDGPKVSAFMAMAPIRPSEVDALTAYLRAMGPGPLASLHRTHMGRFVVIRDFPSRPEWGPVLDDHLETPYLVFTACFDGDRDTYLDELCATPEAPAIWSHCVVAKNEQRRLDALKPYLLHNEIPAGVFFAGYNATVPRVLDVLERYPDPEPGWVSETPTVRVHVARAARIVEDAYDADRARCPVGSLAKRDQHGAEYGTIHGRLTIQASLVPGDLRHGLFAQDGSYDVLARFSPAGPVPWPLCPPAAVGLQILNVPDAVGGGQDFLLGAKTDRFFCRNAEDAVELVKARSASKGELGAVLRFVFPSILPARWRLLEGRIVLSTITRRVGDLLAGTTYYSQITVGCGSDTVVKVGMTTADATVPWRWRRPDLTARLHERMAAGSATAVLRLQRFTEGDDPNDPRRSASGEWVPVGTIVFPAQDIGTGEDLVITPGHHHPDHPPRDEIGEVRVAVYDAISRRRLAINAANRKPTT